ncbi:site-specific DNA-methyltransferase [Campylobacter sp. CS_ED2]|uniref:site-specific DNA-methyltransferase n=1 Tax=Campylobacter sp. CS_ED2 TaxID=2984141 RepID=UPI0022E9C7BD|nr:site-specific DNA-methyltransferase [Campylobacter sp. CS_ED2]MDA3090752.1 site-specific DNA-methyltransferase [Campylobacter sp. CS_ED2]
MVEKIFDNSSVRANSKEIQILKAHFAECFDKDGKFMIDKFEKIVGGGGFLNTENNQNLEFSKESFGLNFLGKSYARFLANQNANSWLKADETHNEQNQNSQNLLIKGDNLEVLRHLQKAYENRIKMIYIDPPYNTGSGDFVYNDERKYTPEQIAKIANLDKDESERLFKFLSKEQSSHSAWCVFMYPRLKLARNLLKDDGVIFISIDDNEQSVLKLLCDEVFGEENFVANIPRKTSHIIRVSNNSELQKIHDYILVYGKNKATVNFTKQETGEKEFPYSDENGKYYLVSLQNSGAAGTREARPNLYYEIYKQKDGKLSLRKDENTIETILPHKVSGKDGRWLWSKDKFNKDWQRLVIKDGKLFDKRYLHECSDLKNYQAYKTWLDEFLNSKGTKELAEILGQQGLFDYPKSTNLLKYLINLSTNPNNNDIILDFFAGSGTTAHAVMDLNATDGGNRKFILVQLDEKIDEKKNKTAYDFCKNELGSENPSIFDITKERIIRAGKKIKDESVNLLNSELDLGFKIYEICENKRALPNDKLDDEISLFENLNELKDKDDLNAVLNAFRLHDGIELTQKCEVVNLASYEAYKFGEKIYLINSNFESENLKILLEMIDNQKEFNPTKIVLYGVNFSSAMQREVCESIKNFANKKELKISVLSRY